MSLRHGSVSKTLAGGSSIRSTSLTKSAGLLGLIQNRATPSQMIDNKRAFVPCFIYETRIQWSIVKLLHA
jgi:hypothetical protein